MTDEKAPDQIDLGVTLKQLNGDEAKIDDPFSFDKEPPQVFYTLKLAVMQTLGSSIEADRKETIDQHLVREKLLRNVMDSEGPIGITTEQKKLIRDRAHEVHKSAGVFMQIYEAFE